MSVVQSVERIVDDPMPKVMIDTFVQQILDEPVLQFQEGIAKHIEFRQSRWNSWWLLLEEQSDEKAHA